MTSLLENIDWLIKQKLVHKQKHPNLPLWIYNYSPQAQGMPRAEWPIALRICRGLILDESGMIVARPFAKFWNYEQVLNDIPPDEGFRVWEKLDGSLGIVCSYHGEIVVSTRGSFESDQAKWAAAWFRSSHPNFYPDPSLTYCFEIIYPENRIVVDYGKRAECVLLAIRDTLTGANLDYSFDLETRFPKARNFDGLKDFAVVNSDPQFQGEEGFVIRWDSGFMAKVKAEEYCRLHRLITQVSTRSIWELLRSGHEIEELLEKVPEEFAKWVNAQATELVDHWRHLQFEAQKRYSRTVVATKITNRKEFAAYATQFENPHLLFMQFDGRDITDAVWKLCEPKYATPFKRSTDE